MSIREAVNTIFLSLWSDLMMELNQRSTDYEQALKLVNHAPVNKF